MMGGGEPAKTPPGFMIYREILQLMKYAPPDKVGVAMIAAARLFLQGETTVIDDELTLDMFEGLSRSIATGNLKYLEACERNRKNAKSRWRNHN